MYRWCRLVHGNYMEYNLLWYDRNVYVTDMSQSVEMDHPSAYDFLRCDCSNVISFIRDELMKGLVIIIVLVVIMIMVLMDQPSED